MAGVASFDFYDERWRDCWIAASSAARLRKKQIDFDIQRRVLKLLEDYGPDTERPLTLRIYGTMIKGFCVINNERARVLFCDCERVVLMFARQPFSEGDNKMHLPAAKRPRMEAALTLDLDLTRYEANEAFDWTAAPLEEGALLRLGGGELPQEAVPPPYNPHAMTDLPLFEQLAAGPAVGTLPGEAVNRSSLLIDEQLNQPPAPPGEVVELPPAAQAPQLELPAAAQSTVADMAAVAEVAPAAPAAEAVQQPLTLAVRAKKRARETVLKPGIVYGFDSEPMMPSLDYERWQQEGAELQRPRLGLSALAATVPLSGQAEELGPALRTLVDPSDALLGDASGPLPSPAPADLPGPALPEPQQLLAETTVPTEVIQTIPPELQDAGAMAVVPLEVGTAGPEPTTSSLESACAELGAAAASANATDAAGVEAQDERTAEVFTIVRSCLKAGGLDSALFSELVPPGGADRLTAACTFSALLALASSGRMRLSQGEPYSAIEISEVC